MDVTVSKTSFGQSAKMLAKILEQKHGPLGKGSLAWSRETLARALKFKTMHELEQFFDRSEESIAKAGFGIEKSESMSARVRTGRFGSLPADELVHALSTVMGVYLGKEKQTWRAQWIAWIRAKVATTPVLPLETYVERLSICSTFHDMQDFRISSAPGPARDALDRYAKGLKGYDQNSASTSRETRDHHDHISAIFFGAMSSAKDLEAFGSTVIAPPKTIAAVWHWSKEGSVMGPIRRSEMVEQAGDPIYLGGTWLKDEWISNIVSIAAKKADHSQGIPDSLNAWDVFMKALNIPLEKDREMSVGSLLDLASLPKRVILEMEHSIAIFEQSLPSSSCVGVD